MNYSTQYRQLILRLPDDLANNVREGIRKASFEGCEYEPESKSVRGLIFFIKSSLNVTTTVLDFLKKRLDQKN